MTQNPAKVERSGSYRWTALGLATLAQVAGCFLVQGLGALGGQMQQALGLNAAQLGLLVSAANSRP